MSKRNNAVETHLSEVPEIGQWLWAFQDTRQRTMEEIGRLTPAMIDWLPPHNESCIGTVLYHLAGIELDWLYTEVLEQPIPPETMALFPYDIRDDQSHLTQVQGIGLEAHLKRLQTVRDLLLNAYQQMSLAEFRRVRSFPHYDVTPEWVLHHLMQHEAEHRSQIGSLRIRAERQVATD